MSRFQINAIPAGKRRGMLMWVLLAFALTPMSFVPGQTSLGPSARSQDNSDASSRQVIRTVRQYYALDSESARKKFPIRIEGTVLYSDPAWNVFWLHTDGGRLFVPVASDANVPPARTRVVIKGVSGLREGAPSIDEVEIREIGKGELPAPKELSAKILRSQDTSDSRVHFAGTVVKASMAGDHVRMVVTFLKQYQVRVTVNHCQKSDLKRLLGSHVGVAGPLALLSGADDRRLAKRHLFVPDMMDVTIYQRGFADPFDAPRIDFEQLNTDYRNRRDQKFLRVRGTLLENSSDNRIVIGDEQHRVTVCLSQPFFLSVGEEVEVVGILWKEEDEIVIDRAFIRKAPEEQDPADQSAVASLDSSLPYDEADLPILRTALSVHGLSYDLATRKYPVEITGVVTYYDKDWHVMFVQDKTGGIYVDEKSLVFPVKVGDRVIVRGVSDPGGFAPMVMATQVQYLGPGQLPSASNVAFGRLMSGVMDSEWIELDGVVKSSRVSQKNLILEMVRNEGSFEVVIAGGRRFKSPREWVGAHLQFTGVCGTKANAKRQASGVYLHVPGPKFIKIISSAPRDPFDIETVPIADLLVHNPDDDARANSKGHTRNKKISGIVTYVDTTGRVALQDASSGIIVRFASEALPKVGDSIDVIGAPNAREFSPDLLDAKWRRSDNSTELPAANPIAIEPKTLAKNDGNLVSVTALVIRNQIDSVWPSLTLQSGGTVFNAEIASREDESDWANLAEQSTIRLNGVLDMNQDAPDWNPIQTFRILCPSVSSVELVSAAPWWNASRAIAVVAILICLMITASVWGGTLRRRVAQQTKRIEQELTERGLLTDRYNKLIDNAGELIFSIHRDGDFVTANPSAESFFNASADELKGSSFLSHLTEESSEAFCHWIDKLNSQEPHAVVELNTTDGHLLEIAVYLEASNNGSEELQCIARDISERRRLENQIRHMQKMESVGQLAAGVAHDYNNLMTVVLGNSEILLYGDSLQHGEAEIVSQIRDAASRASNLTQQLLTFSRRQTMSLSVIHLDALLSDLANMLRRLIGENIELKFDVAESIPPIRGDGGMIEQAVVNLVLNARDAMQNGGTLTISVDPFNVDTAFAKQRVEVGEGEYVAISVSDTGMGMDASTMSNVFEPFFTTKEIGQGTGLGLSTVFGISKQHAGWVDVESAPDKGSTFTLYLPITADVISVSERAEPEKPMLIDGKGKLLIVEDDEAVRFTMKQVLTQAGFSVIESCDGVEAFNIWQQQRQEIDLVVTDMVMPNGMSGRDLGQAIQDIAPHSRIIYCSGYNSEWEKMPELSDTERFLAKPFESKTLVNLVHELLETASPLRVFA